VYVNGGAPGPDITELSDAIKEAYAYAHNTVIWETFALTHVIWPEPILLVDSPTELVTAQGTYQPVTFSASLPETESSVRGQLQLDVEFLPTAYRNLIFAASQEDASIYLRYRQYMSEGETAEPVMELPVALSVSSVEFSDTTTTITALYPDLVNIVLGRRIMTATALPGGRV
jgi:hypothetical protein